MKVLDARFLASAATLPQLPAPMFAEVAFAGRSNVGKSTLINSLVARRKLVRTSSTPGCTRGVNLFRVQLRLEGEEDHHDAELDLVDLPGYGYAKRSKTERRSWGRLIESFLERRAGLRAVVLIIDVRRGLEDDDDELIEYLRSIDRRVIVVATKLDKIPKHQRKIRLKELQKEIGLRVHGYSGEEDLGRDKLWRTLLRAASIAIPGSEDTANAK